MFYQVLAQSWEGIALMIAFGTMLVVGFGLVFLQMGEECGFCGHVRKLLKKIIK